MAYLGNDLQVAFPVYRNIDDISGSFNSSLKTFPLTVSGVAPVPAPLYSQQCLISVGGVVQRPDDTGLEGFRLSGGNIIFASAPTTGADFFGVILAGADYINAGGNFPSGTAAVPSITFNDDLDTGIYNSGINQVSITTGGSERLRIDSAGQIESVSLGTAAAPAFSFTTDPNSGIYSPGADQVAISTGGSGRLFINSSGQVGIGTTANANLSLPNNANINFAGPVSYYDTNSAYSSAADRYIVNGAAARYIQNAGTHVWQYAASGTAGNAISFNEGMRLDSSGRLGIGTSSPAQALDVNGSITTRANGFVRSIGTGSDTVGGGPNTGVGDAGGNAFWLQQLNASRGLDFWNYNAGVSDWTRRLTIDSSGRLGVGTTSPTAQIDSTPADGGNAYAIRNWPMLRNTGTTLDIGGYGSSQWLATRFYTNSSIAMMIDSSQRVGIGTTGPSGTLHVLGGSTVAILQRTGANACQINVGDSNLSNIYYDADAHIYRAGAGTERMRIDSSGRVGIGTSSPSDYLHISSSGGNTAAVRLQASDGRSYIVGSTGSGYGSANNFIIYDATASAERLRITSAGNVGIGTTTPSETLHINGTARLGTTAHTFYANNIACISSSADTTIDASSAQLILKAGSGEAARLDSSKRLLVGTSDGSGGVSKLVVQGASNGSAVGVAQISYNGLASAGLAAGTDIGYLRFTDQGSNSGVFAQITATADATSGANDYPGRLVFSTTADGASSPTERLRITSAGLVGVGTSTPGSILHCNYATATDTYIRTTNSASTNGFDFGVSSGGEAWVFNRNNSNMYLGTNSAQRVTITAGGNVGIGTTSPGYKLHVTGSGDTDIVAESTSTGAALLRMAASTQALAAFNSVQSLYGATESWSIGGSGSQNTIVFKTGTTERARIDSSGRLLVGTSSARANFYNGSISSLFQVEGSGDFPGRAASQVFGNAGADGPIYIFGKHRSNSIGGTTVVQNGDQIGVISFQGSDGTEFVESASIRAEVDGTPGANDMPGRIVLSTTADGASSPTERMRITQGGVHGMFSATDVLSLHSAVTSGTTAALLQGRNSATGVFTGTLSVVIYNNGNVQNTNNSYGAISDIKLKENIVDATSQWSDIKALQVRKYNFKEGQTHTQIGLVAQEVELVSPGLVNESPDRDAEGNDLGTVTKSVNYSVLYMKAVKALQEAMERIEQLEAEMVAVKAQLS